MPAAVEALQGDDMTARSLVSSPAAVRCAADVKGTRSVVKSKSDPSELVDVLPSEELPPLERAEIAERTASVWSLLAKANLTPKEHTVVTLRFGLDGTNEWRTLAEVARHMNCSREYCRQVVQRALRKLRKTGIQSGLVESTP